VIPRRDEQLMTAGGNDTLINSPPNRLRDIEISTPGYSSTDIIFDLANGSGTILIRATYLLGEAHRAFLSTPQWL